MISLKCKHCGKNLKVPDKFAGKKGKCPRCGKVNKIPEAPALTDLADEPVPSQGVLPDIDLSETSAKADPHKGPAAKEAKPAEVVPATVVPTAMAPAEQEEPADAEAETEAEPGPAPQPAQVQAEVLGYLLAVAKDGTADLAFQAIEREGLSPASFDGARATLFAAIRALHDNEEDITEQHIVDRLGDADRDPVQATLDELPESVGTDAFQQGVRWLGQDR